MIVVAEPTYADGEHAAVNAALLRAVALACGPLPFAATPAQHAAQRESAEADPPGVTRQDIAVLPPGGVHLGRMRAQWRTLSALVRQHRASTLLLLSAGPETLFVARLLVARFRRLRVFAVMHGNLATLAGWRSRDPRRRWIDLRSGLAAARHPRIRLIVLETHIRAAARSLGIGHDPLVWPMPSDAGEQAPATAWTPGPRLRLTFVGTANLRKGFGDIVALRRKAGDGYDWAVAGRMSDEFGPADASGFDVPPGRLSRADFLREVRRSDYAVMSFGPEYAFTASASLLDCIGQRKPILAVTNIGLAEMARRYGPIGHLCPDLDAFADLLAQPDLLRDASAYAGFQRGMDAIHADRLPESLARTVRRDMGC